jgi:hypothetical protein
MTRAVAALIVIALSGSPTAQLLCDSRCFADTHPHNINDSACHKEKAAEHGGPRLEVATSSCDMSFGSPFLPEARHKALGNAGGGTAASSALAVPSVNSHREDATVLLRGDSGPPLGHTVTPLRI